MCVRYGGTMSIPLILASKSKPRRDLLFHAGICPTIRVSHVDEPAVVAKAAADAGVSVDDLPIATKVMVLAQAKANAVYQAYKDVAEVSTNAHGDEVTDSLWKLGSRLQIPFMRMTPRPAISRA